MAEITIKEQSQKEETTPSQKDIKNDYNPHRKSTCASFLRAYKPYFIKNISKKSRERSGGALCLNELGIKDEYLYDCMFDPDINVSEIDLNRLFKKIINHSPHFDVILNNAWLQMIDDYVSGLRKLKGRVDQISSLVNVLNKVFHVLDDAYYEISKQVNISIPQVDTKGEQHRRVISKFNRYLDMNTDDTEELAGLKIHSFYKSTPLDMAAQVESVDAESVTFHVHPYIILALQHVAIAFITSPAHEDAYKVYAEHIDLDNRTVTFTSFISHNNEAENRRHVRIEPSVKSRARIISTEAETEGIVYDISEAACAIYVRNANIKKFHIGNQVRFIASLPETSGNMKTDIDTMATIITIYEQGQNDLDAYRIVVKYDNEPAFHANLAKYVLSRQREIIREMKELSESQQDPEKTF